MCGHMCLCVALLENTSGHIFWTDILEIHSGHTFWRYMLEIHSGIPICRRFFKQIIKHTNMSGNTCSDQGRNSFKHLPTSCANVVLEFALLRH